MVVHSFKKCGISLSFDGSENGEIHIECIEDYELPTANEITEFELDSESAIEDDEDNFEMTDSCSSSKNESWDQVIEMIAIYLLLFSDTKSSPVISPLNISPPVISPQKSAFEIIYAQGLNPGFYGIWIKCHA